MCESIGNDHPDNYCEIRFGPEPVRNLPPAAGSQGHRPVLAEALKELGKAINPVVPLLPRLEKLYSSLNDAESKALLVRLMAFRSMGHRKVKLPLNAPAHWLCLKEYESLFSIGDQIDIGIHGWKLRRADLRPVGVPVALYTLPEAAYIIFKLEQYGCPCQPSPIAAEPGAVVIDGGGCWGDTALYFANRVGRAGRVFTFEFLPGNLRILRQNLELNPELAPAVEIVPRALWDSSDAELCVRPSGPGTRVSASESAPGAERALSLTIDDLAASRNLDKVDFIKLDIEGAELAALRGAARVLRTFKPKLAIAVYHNLTDFFDIPDYLESLGLGYRFYLRHFTYYAEETVLFARAP